jgi:hypothetical protein
MYWLMEVDILIGSINYVFSYTKVIHTSTNLSSLVQEILDAGFFWRLKRLSQMLSFSYYGEDGFILSDGTCDPA